MQKIKILATGEVKEVSNNEAHDLIDSKKAVLYKPEMGQYTNRQMTTGVPQLKQKPLRAYKSKRK